MNLHLSFLAYGTVIPDLRAVLYQRRSTPVSLGDVFCVDSFLRGREDTDSIPENMTWIDSYYRRLNPNHELIEIMDAIIDSGGFVSVHINSNIRRCTESWEVFSQFIDSLPSGVNIVEGVPEPSTPPLVSNVFVARQTEYVDLAINRGFQTIQYESARRLRRELELRGFGVPQIDR